jgi:hypothetical protein
MFEGYKKTLRKNIREIYLSITLGVFVGPI